VDTVRADGGRQMRLSYSLILALRGATRMDARRQMFRRRSRRATLSAARPSSVKPPKSPPPPPPLEVVVDVVVVVEAAVAVKVAWLAADGPAAFAHVSE